MITEEANRLVENDRLGQVAQAENEKMELDVESSFGDDHYSVRERADESSGFDIMSLRAENAAWKRIVSYMMREQGGMGRRSKKIDGRRRRERSSN